jgi:hypothetical protein
MKSLTFCATVFLLFLRQQQNFEIQAAPTTCSPEYAENGNCPTEKQASGGSVWKIPKNVVEKSKEAAKKAQIGEGTRVISNLIDDPDLLHQLTNHREWFSCYENTRGSRTHWYEKDTPPSSIWEYLAIQMWQDQPILKGQEFAGFEIWCNILTSEGPLTWHVDKDQILFEQSGGTQLNLPLYGSVWYGYPHDFEGGFLEITNWDTDTWPEGMDEPDPTVIERIEAEYNRLVVFNASKFHRVSPIHSGARLTLAVNAWKTRPGDR